MVADTSEAVTHGQCLVLLHGARISTRVNWLDCQLRTINTLDDEIGSADRRISILTLTPFPLLSLSPLSPTSSHEIGEADAYIYTYCMKPSDLGNSFTGSHNCDAHLSVCHEGLKG